jgi:hypothetical protein
MSSRKAQVSVAASCLRVILMRILAATTMMELEIDLRAAADHLKAFVSSDLLRAAHCSHAFRR